MVNEYYREFNGTSGSSFFRNTWHSKYILEALPKNGKNFNNRNHHSPWMDLVTWGKSLNLFGLPVASSVRNRVETGILEGFFFLSSSFFFFLHFCSFFSSSPPTFFFVWLYHMACRILVPNQGPKTCLPCTRSSVLTTGIAREVPWKLFLVLNRHYTKNPEVYHRYCLYSCTEWSVIHK